MRGLVLALVGTLGLVAGAEAGWASLGAMRPERDGAGLLFRGPQGLVAVTPLSAEVIRVRFSPTAAFGRDHSYAVVSRSLGDPKASVEVGASRSEIATGALRVKIGHDPFRIAFASAAGESLDEDDEERGIAFAGRQIKVWKRLRDDEHVYGFGEKTGRLDKRGWGLGGYSYAMWNTDTYAYDAGTDPVYASVPFYMVLREGRAHGVFLDNTHRSAFDVGKESEHLLSFGAEAGELDYYFIDGPHPKQVIERYTALTGRMPLPPLWSLGYHQCRWSYYPEARVRDLARGFRERRIPADVVWLDIHYEDGYKPFTWDRERFPDPRGLIADLRHDGFRMVTIVDPHPKKQAGYVPYDSGVAGGHFVRRPDGSLYEGPVWPASAERDPGPSVFPDFSRSATREWWGGLHAGLLDDGVAGIWNDMNEPAVFVEPAHTFPTDIRHDNEGEPTDHAEIHNVYGMLMTRATREGLLRLRPEARPFVLTRASFAGGQRYAALWPGDNVSDWSHLRQSIPTLLGMGLSGLPFVGSDIGGFAGAPSAELFTRWLQLGAFYPFMRTHTALGTPDQEPWSYGARHEELNRRAIERRYELLPHVYNLMREASQTGLPAMRPVFLEFPRDPRTWALDDQLMLGADLLVAPVLREGALTRSLYLPAGRWFELETGREHAGGRSLELPVTLDTIPVFARQGAFVFGQPAVQHTGEMPGQPLRVTVFPAAASEASLYEDAGDGFAYREGSYLRRRFAQRRDDRSITIGVSAPEGRFRPVARCLELRLAWAGAEPRHVRIGSRSVARRGSGPGRPGEIGEAGWALEASGFLVVTLPDTFASLEVSIERP